MKLAHNGKPRIDIRLGVQSGNMFIPKLRDFSFNFPQESVYHMTRRLDLGQPANRPTAKKRDAVILNLDASSSSGGAKNYRTSTTFCLSPYQEV